MYKYENALAIRPFYNVWEKKDLKNIPLRKIFQEYEKVIFVISNNFLTSDVYLNAEEIRDETLNSDLTLDEWFASIDKRKLNTTDSIINIKQGIVYYQDAFTAKWKVQTGNISKALDIKLPASEKNDLFITKKGDDNKDIDYKDIGKKILLSVNGYIHFHDTNDKGIWILDGYRKVADCNENTLGIIDFEEVCSMETIRLTKDMIKRRDKDLPMKDSLVIKPNIELDNKTTFLIFCGYLVLPSYNLFRVSSDNTLILNTKLYPLLRRYMESLDYINYDSLKLEKNPKNESMVDIETFYSDENIINMLMHNNSFLAVLDTKYITIDKYPVTAERIPYRFFTHNRPIYPMLVGTGKLSNYLYRPKFPEDWVLLGYRTKWNYYTDKIRKMPDEKIFTDHRDTMSRVNYSDGTFLIIKNTELK